MKGKRPGKKSGKKPGKKKKKTISERRRIEAERHKQRKLKDLREDINELVAENSRKVVLIVLEAELTKQKRELAIWKGQKVENLNLTEKNFVERIEVEKKQRPDFYKASLAYHQAAIELYQITIKRLKQFKIIE